MSNNEIFELNDKKYSLEYQPAVLNFEEYPKLKAQVDSLRDEFSKWEVTPENIKASKEARAKLRKFSKAVNQKKIKIVKVIDAPVSNFKDQIKGLCKEVDQTAGVIDSQIKVYEEKVRQDRHERNVEYIKKTIKENKLSDDCAKFVLDNYNAKWDNKSYRYPVFQKEVADLIEQFMNITRFKHEAHETIISRASELSLMPDKYIESLDRGEDLNNVLQNMKDERNYLNELSKKQAETKKREQADLAKHKDQAYDPETGEIKEKVFTVALELKGTKDQLTQLNAYLNDMGITAKRLR